jgi:hypothetical protein
MITETELLLICLNYVTDYLQTGRPFQFEVGSPLLDDCVLVAVPTIHTPAGRGVLRLDLVHYGADSFVSQRPGLEITA